MESLSHDLSSGREAVRGCCGWIEYPGLWFALKAPAQTEKREYGTNGNNGTHGKKNRDTIRKHPCVSSQERLLESETLPIRPNFDLRFAAAGDDNLGETTFTQAAHGVVEAHVSARRRRPASFLADRPLRLFRRGLIDANPNLRALIENIIFEVDALQLLGE